MHNKPTIMVPKRRGVRFERHASRIEFDPASCSFLVTWVKCGHSVEERLASHRDPVVWLPSVSAIATLFDRGRIPPQQVVYAARAIGKAWIAGDRELLDTDEAKKAAELVSDLSSMCVDPSSPSVASDIGQAMRHLLDEMAAVRFMDTKPEAFGEDRVMPSMEKALRECISAEGFLSWPPASKRRRFLFCLNKKERSEVGYTLVSLLFDTGSCPILSLADRRILRRQALCHSGLGPDFSEESVMSFFRFALSRMREVKNSGHCRVGGRLTQQQLTDTVTQEGASSPA